MTNSTGIFCTFGFEEDRRPVAVPRHTAATATSHTFCIRGHQFAVLREVGLMVFGCEFKQG